MSDKDTSALAAPTLSAQELGDILDLAVNATAQVGRVLQARDLFDRAARLANSPHRLGELVPTVTPEG
jgi:hypothetical protein